MSADDALAARFEADRQHLRGVAFRVLGSLDDADDALQQTWIKASHADLRNVQNLTGWLTTVTARESLDVLRARKRRGEVALPDDQAAVGAPAPSRAVEERAVEEEVILAESVGRALLVVLDRLTPAERVALVLHDMFTVPFDEIAPIVDRSPIAAKKLASRARQKVAGKPSQQRAGSSQQLAGSSQQRRLADAFLSATRRGDITGLLAVLAPDVVRRADPAALPPGRPAELRGADAVAKDAVVFGRPAAVAELALIDGTVGIVVAPRGRLTVALTLTFGAGKISGYTVIANQERLAGLSISLLDYPSARSQNQ